MDGIFTAIIRSYGTATYGNHMDWLFYIDVHVYALFMYGIMRAMHKRRFFLGLQLVKQCFNEGKEYR
jgi:hypothetical protein